MDRIFKLLLFISVQLVTINMVFAQQWSKINVPRSRDINDVELIELGKVLAVGGNYRNDSIEWVIRTYDSGITWDLIADKVSSWLTAVDFTDSLQGFAVGTHGKILHTLDGGSSWTKIPYPLNRDFNDIIFPTANMGIIVGGTVDSARSRRQTILKSTNGGQNWSVVRDTAGSWLKSVSFRTPLIGYAVGDSGIILKTTDGGDSWLKISSPTQRDLNSVYLTDTGTGCIVGGQPGDSVRTILRTGNGGNTWNIIKDEPGGVLNDVWFLNADTGYVVGDEASFFKTVDGGQTWQYEIVTGSHRNDDFNAVRFLTQEYGFVGGTSGAAYIFSFSGEPEVQTLGAIYQATGDAQFFGNVNTNGFPGKYWFTFSLDSLFTDYFETFIQPIQTNAPVTVSYTLNNLVTDTTYYYFISASTLTDVAYGDTLTLSTVYQALNRVVNTAVATLVTDTSAQLNALIDDLAFPATLSFEYGLTKALGSVVVPSPGMITDTASYQVAASIGGLLPDTIYYYRIKAMSSLGITYYGDLDQLFTGSAIPNWDFQHWEDKEVDLPDKWTVANENFDRVAGRSGNYALKMEKGNIVVLGKIWPDNAGGSYRLFYSGIPLSSAPDSIFGYFNYDLPTGDTALIAVQLSGNGNIFLEYYPIAGSSGGNFERLAFKLNYSSSFSPDTLAMAFVSSNPFDTTGKDNTNNMLVIDNIGLSGSVAALPNAGFEDWFHYAYRSLVDWSFTEYIYYDNLISGEPPMVTRDFYDPPADFAVEIRNMYGGNGIYLDGSIQVSENDRLFDDSGPAFPVNHRHLTLNGYYRFYPAGKDTVEVIIRMFHQGKDLGTGTARITDTVDQFQPFTARINYNDTVLVPDSASLEITIQSSNGPSVAAFDKLSFDGFFLSVIDSIHPPDTTHLPVLYGENIPWRLFPNPAHKRLLVEWQAVDYQPYIITLLDLNGREVYRTAIRSQSIGLVRTTIPLSQITGGFYIVKLSHRDQANYRKLIILD